MPSITPDELVYSTLRETGLPGTRVGWPVGGAPPLPWFTYARAKKGEFFADDSNYAALRRYRIDLYQAEVDDNVRDVFEEHVARLGPFSSTETWVPVENCWQFSYTVTFDPTNS